MRKSLEFGSVLMGFAMIVVSARSASAQSALSNVVPDSTLGTERSIVEQNNQVELIRGGAQRGQNLFHSFQEFNINEGRSTYFLNSSNTVQNILARVTGKNPSAILGTLGIQNAAGITAQPNLFLINPQGILFGANARLDIGGSFLATTANRLQFGSQGDFSATNPETPALLTINPSALFFTQSNQGAIVSRSTAPAGTNAIGQALFGLRVPDGQSLAFVGGDILIDGGGTGGVRALGGRIEFGGLSELGEIRLDNQLRLSYPDNTPRSNVSLINNAGISVRGTGGGEITVNAHQFTATNGGRLVAGTDGGGSAGSITLNANTVTVSGTAVDGTRSGLFNSVGTNATGNGGDISINTNILSVASGARINAVTQGQGNLGNLFLNVLDQITVDGTETGIFNDVEPGAIANAGEIRINTGSFSLSNGARMVASTFGRGNAGDIILSARDAVTIASEKQGFFSAVAEQAIGNGGTILINTGSLILDNRSGMTTSTNGQGNAGRIVINARDQVRLDSAVITNNVESTAIGQGGEIQIATGSLSLANAARLETATYGRGKAGNLLINARDTVIVAGQQTYITGGTRGNAIVEQSPENLEPGGNLRISAGSLFLRNGGSLNSTTFGQGDAGKISLDVRDRIVLEGSNSTILSSTSGRGNGGEIVMTAGNAVILNPETAIGSNVTLSGMGQAGNLLITTGSLSILGGSQISANTAGQGNGGNITINAHDINFSGFSIDNQRNLIVPSSLFQRVENGAIGNAGDLVIKADSLTLSNGATILGSSRGQGNSSNILITVRDRITLQDQSSIMNDLEQTGIGRGGSIQIQAEQLLLESGSGVFAGTSGTGKSGDISIDVGVLSMKRPIDLNRAALTLMRNRLQGILDLPSNLFLSGEISTTTSGDGDAGNIRIHARNDISADAGNISSTVLSGGSPPFRGNGRGGDIRITTPSLNLANSSTVTSASYGQGRAGNIWIDAQDSLTLQNNSNIVADVSAFSDPEATGNGGDIQIKTRTLSIAQGGTISSTTSSPQGNAGKIEVRASDRIALDGNASIASASLTPNSGNAGFIEMTTRFLSLTNGAFLISATQGNGDGGVVTIRADDQVLLRNALINNITNGGGKAGSTSIRTNDLVMDNSFIINGVAPGAIGRGGNIDINTASLSSYQSVINTATQGQGDGGSITLRARDRMLLSDNSLVSTNTFSTGRSGDLRILETGVIKIQQNAGIAVGSFGSGQSGNIEIQANLLSLDRGVISADTLSVDGGNIKFNLNALTLQKNSQISTSAGNLQAGGNGGNIEINSGSIVAPLGTNSLINANAFRGNGGKIQIETQGIFGFSPPLAPTATTNKITASSQFGVNGTVTLNTPGIDLSRGLSELPSNFVDRSNQITQRCTPRSQKNRNSLINIGRGGIPQTPNDPFRTNSTQPDWISSTLDRATEVPTQSSTSRSDNPTELVQMQGWIKDAKGDIYLVAQSPTAESHSVIVPSCP